MKLVLNSGKRVFQHSLVIATTFVTCAALQANEHDNKQHTGSQHSEKQGEMTADKFIQKAMMSGKLEVQMGQLGQQRAENQQVKSLAEAILRDHQQANQKLQQIASREGVSVQQSQQGQPGQQGQQSQQQRLQSQQGQQGQDMQAKHQHELEKLRTQSGAEFDKAFVTAALKHHKKDIQEFERASKQLNDTEVKAFIDQTLPKLRQHYQMAQTAARAVGVDEASIAADVSLDSDQAAGAAAGSATGTRQNELRGTQQERRETDTPRTTDRPRSSIDADLDVDTDDANVQADVDTDGDRIFQKGDGKILGLPTDKNDGTFLGIIPNPRADNDDNDADVVIEADVDSDRDSVGSPGTSEVGSDRDDR